MKKAVYAGSFDPLTNGHLWIIEQATALFDSVVIAIGENSDKSYTFTTQERIEILEQVTKNFKNVEVTQFENEFLVNYAKKIDAKFIIRGIRNSTDYEYERRMRYINSDLCQEINTIFLMPPRNFVEVSSSLIKGLIGLQGWEETLGHYLPKPVLEKIIFWWQKNNLR